ncbi:hypothetical protein HKX48_007500 [Thoreauomyces humboldtii]|nr:hypothetical protein HKX48_007500 [Thoreauomyces humboldtii]
MIATAAEEYGLAEAHAAFDGAIKRSMESKRIQMEERIIAFRVEQQALLEREQTRISRDADILWAQVCNLHRDRLNRHLPAGEPGPSTGRIHTPGLTVTLDTAHPLHDDAATAGSFYQRGGVGLEAHAARPRRRSLAPSVTQASPVPTDSILPKAEDAPGSDDASEPVRKVRFGNVRENGPGEDESRDSAYASDEGDAIFELDGFEDRPTDRFQDMGPETDDDVAEDESSDSPTEDSNAAALALYSSSLPIRIPSMSRLAAADPVPPIAEGNEDSELPDEEGPAFDESDGEGADGRFVAPHILSARTYTQDYLLAMRPNKGRKTSFAM